MFADLEMWDAATALASDSKSIQADQILKRKAQTLQEKNDLVAAAATYTQVGDYLKAAEILGSQGYSDKLIELVRKVSNTEITALQKCLYYFKKLGHNIYAIETCKKMGDLKSLVNILVETMQWEEAFQLVQLHQQYQELVSLPYGHWLAANDRFEEAQAYYIKGGKPEEATRVLKSLCQSSVHQKCFDDAAYHYFSLSKQLLYGMNSADVKHDFYISVHEESKKCRELSEIYYAYEKIFRFIEDPFTLTLPEHLISCALFLLLKLKSNIPEGVSQRYILYTLAKVSNTLKEFKICKFAFEKLRGMRMDPTWQDAIELGTALIKGKGEGSPKQMKCYQCDSNYHPTNLKDDSCVICKEPFVRSFLSFEPMAIARFEPTVPENEAITLIMEESVESSPVDMFQKQLLISERQENGYSPIKLNAEQLRDLDFYKVFIREIAGEKQYYMQLSGPCAMLSKCCQQFFIEEQWEYLIISQGQCPFCRAK
jgi:intraflagellar transport protein 122